jgi:hypothetical protein
VPMQARRPTHQETIRVHAALTQLVPHVAPLPVEAQHHTELDTPPAFQQTSIHGHLHEQSHQFLKPPHEDAVSKSIEAEHTSADEDSEIWKSFVVACQKSQLPRLKTAVQQCDPTLHFIRSDGCTLLHVAASAGSWRVVDLLLDAGVSPMPRDRRRKSAYDVSKDRETRDAFRRSM